MAPIMISTFSFAAGWAGFEASGFIRASRAHTVVSKLDQILLAFIFTLAHFRRRALHRGQTEDLFDELEAAPRGNVVDIDGRRPVGQLDDRQDPAESRLPEGLLEILDAPPLLAPE